MEEQGIPKLYGLVLSGGKSTRMGLDKSQIQYHGVPHQEYLYQLLQEVCDAVFLSVRMEQLNHIPSVLQTIIDDDSCKGPFNGILSAHKKYPDVAWLVLACDLPLIDAKTILQLYKHRNPNKFATSFATHETKLPEPLVTIWEPKGLVQAMVAMETKNIYPRKFLINSDIELIFPNNDQVLYNANCLAEHDYAKSKIS